MKTRLALLCFLAASCGGSKGAGPDAAPEIPDAADGAPDAAPPPPDAGPPADAFVGPSTLAGLMPQEVAFDSAAILAAPVVVPITYNNDPNLAGINAYYAALGASQAWTDQVSEYGVGAMTEGTPRDLGAMPGTETESNLLSTLSTHLTDGSWGSADANTIYVFHIPDGVNFEGNSCCGMYDGYHNETNIGGVDVAYAVDCACPSEATFYGITLFQDMGVTMGHEAVEAATDPHFATDTGYGYTDDAHAAWTYVTEGELADLCEYADTEIWLNAAGTNATQRTWSNAAAAAGHDPCVGDPTVPYYQGVPSDPDSGTVQFSGGNWNTKGLRIAVGATGTLTLTVLSDVPTAGPFKVVVKDYDQAFFQGSPYLQPGTITGTYNSGDSLTVPVKVLSTDPSMNGGETYVVETTPVSGGGPTTYWFGLILQ
jgi:hypothetical protein